MVNSYLGEFLKILAKVTVHGGSLLIVSIQEFSCQTKCSKGKLNRRGFMSI